MENENKHSLNHEHDESLLNKGNRKNFFARFFTDRITWWIRFSFSFVIAAFLIINVFTNFAITSTEPESITDIPMDLTKSINKALNENKSNAKLLLIINGIMNDVFTILSTLLIVKYTKGLSPFYSIVLYFLIKIFLGQVYSMKYPEGMIWEYPGFPSLTISYTKTIDFGMSGILGVNMILSISLLYIYRANRICIYLAIFGFLLVLFQYFIFTVLRSHYFLSLIIALLTSHYCTIISNYIDEKIQQRFYKFQEE